MRKYELYLKPAIMGGYYLLNNSSDSARWMPVADYEELESAVRAFKVSLNSRVASGNYAGIVEEFAATFPGI